MKRIGVRCVTVVRASGSSLAIVVTLECARMCVADGFHRPVVTVDELLRLLQRLEDAAGNELFPDHPMFGQLVRKAFRSTFRLLPKESSSLLAEMFIVLLNQLLDASVESFFGGTQDAMAGERRCAVPSEWMLCRRMGDVLA